MECLVELGSMIIRIGIHTLSSSVSFSSSHSFPFTCFYFIFFYYTKVWRRHKERRLYSALLSSSCISHKEQSWKFLHHYTRCCSLIDLLHFILLLLLPSLPLCLSCHTFGDAAHKLSSTLLDKQDGGG